MNNLDFFALARAQKPVKGQRLAEWLKRFLAADSDQLSRWTGSFTEVTTAKVVEIFRKRGVIETTEVQECTFALLRNIAYRLPVYVPEVEVSPSPDSSRGVHRANPQDLSALGNPFLGGNRLDFSRCDSAYVEQNRAFFARLGSLPQWSSLVLFGDEVGDEGYYALVAIEGETKIQAMPVPVFMTIAGIAPGALRATLESFFQVSVFPRWVWNNLAPGIQMEVMDLCQREALGNEPLEPLDDEDDEIEYIRD